MSAITIGSGGGGGGGGGIVAVPRSGDGPGQGARVWLHNNTADLSTVYTSNEVYPPDTSTDPATADPRVNMSVARAWQFSDADPVGYGVGFPMEFATAEEAVNIDDTVVFYPRTVMKITGTVTAKLRFNVGLTGAAYDQGARMELRKIAEGDDDLVVLREDSTDLRQLAGAGEEAGTGIGDAARRVRNIVFEIPWMEFASGDLIYMTWDTEGSAGSVLRAYCQAEYLVH